MNGLYRTIVADPPWPGDWWAHSPVQGRRYRTRPTYETMALEEILALPIATIAADDANLFLWIPPKLNREGVGVRVARAWGFEPASEIVWEKPYIGQGRFPRLCHEILLVCSRGQTTLTGPWDVRSVQRWKGVHASNGSAVHSAKPPAAIDLIEAHSPGPYVELFARPPHRLGWDVYGDQSANTAALNHQTAIQEPPERQCLDRAARETRREEVGRADATRGVRPLLERPPEHHI